MFRYLKVSLEYVAAKHWISEFGLMLILFAIIMPPVNFLGAYLFSKPSLWSFYNIVKDIVGWAALWTLIERTFHLSSYPALKKIRAERKKQLRDTRRKN